MTSNCLLCGCEYEKFTGAKYCVPCRYTMARKRGDAWSARNRARIRSSQQAYRASNPDKRRATQKKSYRKNAQRHKETNRRLYLMKAYGITVAQYDNALSKQGGVCAVCRSACVTGKRLAVDHDHDTGEIRGLLCLMCNKGLGSFRDNPRFMDAAASYIRIHQMRRIHAGLQVTPPSPPARSEVR